MVKQEKKQILTRADCEKELKRSYRVIGRGNLIMLLILSVIFIPLSLIPGYIVKEMNDPTTLVYVIAVVATLILVSPILYWIYRVCVDFYHLRLIYKGEFSIVEDEVNWMAEGEREKRLTVNAVYFYRYDRYVIWSSATWGITHPGDIFYLLILHTKKPTVVNAFPTKIYEWQEDPSSPS